MGFFFQAEDCIRDAQESRGLGDVYKRQGMENVVALAGSSVSPEQITGARLKGAKKFTICLDQEPEKAPETADRITRIINLILEQGTNRIYIAKLPDLEGGKVDPDSLIRERGINAFKTAIEQAQPYYRHLFSTIADKYKRLSENRGPLTDKELADFIEDIKETGSRIAVSYTHLTLPTIYSV